MRFHAHAAPALLAATLLSPRTLAAQGPVDARLPSIDANDNRAPAGRVRNRALHVELELRPGRWRPHGSAGPEIPVLAFSERGRAPSTPGPLLRTRAGQEVVASVHNRTSHALVVFGLGGRDGAAPDSFLVAAGARHVARFRAPPAGTYYYAAARAGTPLHARFEDDAQLNGLFIVDPPSGPAHPRERFFLISWWFQDPDTTAQAARPALGTMVINGLGWPHTERLHAGVGDTLRWRWVNLTEAPHPMHLHGFYFRVDARGDGQRDTLYTPEQQRLAVTERLEGGKTMAISWSPERPGNWLFHCHFAFHISHNVALVPQRRFSDVAPAEHAGHAHVMGGLALGIQVRERGPRLQPAARREVRPIRLTIRSWPNVYGDRPGYGYALDEPAGPAASPRIGGPALVLERDQPVAITLLNRSHEPAAVHWHGIELESFPDGVPGWSGERQNLLRPIPPGDSLTIRFTPPRSGTFMYHSHLNELQQIASGLYGALLVVPPETPLDPARDHTFLISTGGSPSGAAPILINGDTAPPPLVLRAGETHRLRFISIVANGGGRFSLERAGTPVQWTPAAKDGADLPPWQRTPQAAQFRIVAGETYDFGFDAGGPEELQLVYRRGENPPITIPVRVEAGGQVTARD